MNKKKQRILFVSNILWGGGQEKVMHFLAHNLDRNAFEPHVAHRISRENVPATYDPSIPIYCLDPDLSGDQKNLKAIWQGNRIRRFVLNMIPPGFKARIRSLIFGNMNPIITITQSIQAHLRYTHKLRDVLAKLDKDVIIVAFQEGPTVQAWLNQIYGAHRFVSFLCAPESIYFHWLYPEQQKYIVEKWMFSNACRSALQVSVPNQWMKDDMVTEFGVPSEKIRIVPNPIDCRAVAHESEMPLDLDMDLAGKTVFVQLARMDPQKNHDLTVKACRILRQNYENFVVLLIGDGTEKERIQRSVMEEGLQEHLIFLGAKANPYPYLKIARASILTSSFEASPLALIESMSLGVVPVSVDCIAGPAELLDHGRCGLLVPPDNPAAFADAMLRIASDEPLWQGLRERGMKHALNFDVSRFIKVWENLLLEVGKEQNDTPDGNG